MGTKVEAFDEVLPVPVKIYTTFVKPPTKVYIERERSMVSSRLIGTVRTSRPRLAFNF